MRLKNKIKSRGVGLSIVTPAYNESQNLPLLYERLRKTFGRAKANWEWIVVDDHSSDDTYRAIAALAHKDPRVHAIRFARNSGSHLAISCGLRAAQGQCAAVLAADLQDPPELVLDLMSKWKEGSQVVWAVRAKRESESFSTLFFARLYYFLMRHFVGLKEMAPSGADFFLLDRTVINALGKFGEKNTSLLSLISWMGFRQNSITYNKQKRAYGKSGWTLQKKLKLVADSITAFSYTPIRLISWFGACTLLVGLASLGGDWWLKNSPLYFPILICISGLQMLMMGVMGECLWRTFDESRRRPSYLIEEATHPVLLSFFEE